jgi:hypothetical protein
MPPKKAKDETISVKGKDGSVLLVMNKPKKKAAPKKAAAAAAAPEGEIDIVGHQMYWVIGDKVYEMDNPDFGGTVGKYLMTKAELDKLRDEEEKED